MPSVNVIQTAEPRLQPPPAAHDRGGEPFSELLDSAAGPHHGPEEPHAKPHKRHDPPPQARHNRQGSWRHDLCRTDAPARGDAPVREGAPGPCADAEGAEGCTESAGPGEETAQSEQAGEGNETAGAKPNAELCGTVCPEAAAAPETDEHPGEDSEIIISTDADLPLPPTTTEIDVSVTGTLSTETPTLPSIGINQPVAEPVEIGAEVSAASLAPGIAMEAAPATPLPGLQQALTAAASTPAKPTIDATPEQPAAVVPAVPSDAKKSAELAQAPQAAIPALPAAASDVQAPSGKIDLQPAQQQDGQQVAELKPVKAAGPAAAEHVAAPPPNDAPKAQPGPAQPAAMPEPVRALAASFNPAGLQAANTNQPNAVSLNATAIAVEIASRMREGMRRFEIRLDPPELGRIDVRLEVDRNGHATTKLTVDRVETLDLLQREARGLERALQQAGLKTDQGGLEFSLRQQTNDGQGYDHANQPKHQPELIAGEDGDPIEAVIEGYRPALRAHGGIDIKV